MLQKSWDTSRRNGKRGRGQKRKLLVVFCPNLTNPYYVMLLQGIEAHAKEKGFGLLYVIHREISDGRTLSENDVAVKTAWNYLYL